MKDSSFTAAGPPFAGGDEALLSDGTDDGHFPGWHSAVPNPADATNIDVVANSNITDAVGNSVQHRVEPSGFYTLGSDTADFNDQYWDTDEPYFSTYQVSPLSYEIVTDIDIVTQKINRLEFFIQDNYESEDLANGGVWDPENDHPDQALR